MIEIYWACELHTTDVSFGAWRPAALEGSKCFVLVKWESEMLVLDLTLLYFDTCRYYYMVRRSSPSFSFAPSLPLSPSLSFFSQVRCLSFPLLLGWMMLCISVEALRKPQGTEGSAEQSLPRKESLPGVECSDKLLKGGWTLVLFLCLFFFFSCTCFLFLHHQLNTKLPPFCLLHPAHLFLFTLPLCP